MSKDLVLSIDCGTQSLRALIVDLAGTVLAREKMEYNPYVSPCPGWAEQDPDIFWKALCTGCHSLRANKAELFDRIAGIGLCSQRDSMINLAADGMVLRPAVSWLDTRKAEGSYRPNPIMKSVYRIIGKDKAIRKTMRDGKCNWIRENQPEIWEKTWKYLQVSGFLNYKLCGEAFDSVASMVGHVPMNYKKRCWDKQNSLKGRLFPVEEEKRYPLLEPGEQGGVVSPGAAGETGLPQGLPVIACGSDKSCETLGMGCLDNKTASLSFGTTATVEVCTRDYLEPLPFIPAYCAAIPGSWIPEVEIYRGYWMISWFRDEMGHKEMEEARRRGILPEELLNRLLHAEPPGCRGLMMQPYWGPGLKDPLAKGSFIGFGDLHTRASLYRAIIEGLGYGLRDGLETMEGRGHFRCSRLAVSGGASQSDLICQITADIFGRPLFRGKTYENSGLGAAIIAAAGLGFHSSIEAAAKQMAHMGKSFTPRGKESRLYDQLYGVYKRIYPRMKHLYHDIQHITGYPEI